MRTLLTIAILIVLAGSTFGWDTNEHQFLADSAFAHTGTQSELWKQLPFGLKDREARFGERVAQYAKEDFASNRFHERGRTIPDQLRSLARPDNVVAAFLHHHLKALELASAADFEGALESEAHAQGYLADAFSAGHILSYNRGMLAPLQKRNRVEAHSYHRDRGVYVVNGRGDLWQTFGDGLLHWYPPTYQAVLEACETSLKELLVVSIVAAGWGTVPDELDDWLRRVAPGKTADDVVASWLEDREGSAYYSELRLPSLMFIPMPVSASWSHRTDERDDHGSRIRHHYLQFREDGCHDPDLHGIDTDFLYSLESVPEWMVPPPLRDGLPGVADLLITTDSNWASVRWVQQRYAPPSYKGLLLQWGGQLTIGPDDTRTGGTVGVGYGLWDDLLLIKNVSCAATFMPSLHEPNHLLLVGSAGLSLDLPGNGWLNALRFEGGLGFGIGEDFDDVGPLFALGCDSKKIPLKFTYAGLIVRAKYQWLYLDTPLGGPVIELVLH